MLEDVNLDNYDYIQFTDQDNILVEPLSTYCNLLDKFPNIYFTTGYLSKEHWELDWINTEYGRLCIKKSLRAGHMVMRTQDLKKLFPLRIDRMYHEPLVTSIWTAGLDWELSWWNPKSPGMLGMEKFVLCVPGGVLHRGIDSTVYEWPVLEHEYTDEELIDLRYNTTLVES
jgi:hypothetical protein